MAAFVGSVKEFVVGEKESFEAYEERIEFFMKANKVTDAEQKQALFFTVCGEELYQLIRSLVAPSKTYEKTYKEVLDLVKEHLNPKPNVIVERYQFYNRVRKAGETVPEFVAELRNLSRHCQFTDNDEMMRDRLVCGINDVAMQRKLLAESELDLKRAVRISVGMELAAKESAAMTSSFGSRELVHNVDQANSKREFCFRCGDDRHKTTDCRFKDKDCYACKKKGHISKVCKSRKKSKQVNSLVEEEPSKTTEQSPGMAMRQISGDGDELFHIYRAEIRREAPILISVRVNDRDVEMELDTGASITVFGSKELEEAMGPLNLHDTLVRLKTYGGRTIKPVVVVDVEVENNGQKKTLPVVVTSEPRPILLGRNWLSELDLDWKGVMADVFPVAEVAPRESPGELEALLEECSEVFGEGLGLMKGTEVHLQLKQEARPKFFRARSVPYALKKGIEDELDHLVKQGGYVPVSHSDWAAPIVPVKKEDGGIRICGDYKLTVNPCAESDSYPVPKTEDLLATLNGGEKFTKLDMRQAYQQLKLDSDSQKMCTVNTHRGLFQPTRLQYGIHAASGVFQREMEGRLAGIPRTVVRVDDILVTGEDTQQHLENLGSVLRSLKANGLRLKRSKCTFFSPSVIYLGFRISSQGVEPLQEKVGAVLEAPTPKDTTQLKSFLGMLQYYHRHLPDLARVLEPVHQLLRKGQKWVWRTEQEVAFKKTKEVLAGSDLLVNFDPLKPLVLAVDASPYGVGAVLSHLVEGVEKPIAYASRTMNSAERNYCHTEREGLAMVYGVKKFHQYLYGHKFQLYTDHKPLLGIFGEYKPIPTHSAARVQRWALIMAAYNYELLYRPGEQNANADGMS